MYEIPVWLLTLLGQLRSLFVAFLKACEYLLTVYFLTIDYTVDKLFLALGPHQGDNFSEWVIYSLDKEAADYTDMFDVVLFYAGNISAWIYRTGFIVVVWFAAFFLPFSHLTAPTATNEYLLLSCILFTLFFVYNQIAVLANDATAAVEPIGQDICRQAARQSDVGFYHEDSSLEYVGAFSSFEGLLAVVETANGLTYAADDVLYEDALASTAGQSLQSAVYEEAALDLLDISCEELEESEVVVDDLVEELEEVVL